MYRRAKHTIVCWTRRWLFELAVAQTLIGLGLWGLAYLVSPGEPPIILAMSALALGSGLTTMAVVAIDENNGSNDA
jgi:hypothetical protein